MQILIYTKLIIPIMLLTLPSITSEWILNQYNPIVQVQSGDLRGVISFDRVYGRYYSFYGIPYAKVEQRFQESQPVLPWKGVLEANARTVKCSQKSWFFSFFSQRKVLGQEDCLTLNVYSPLANSKPLRYKKLKPVMVFFHGGGFQEGSSSSLMYGPEYIIRHDVILVVVNYRLGIFGFLCLKIKEAPGNVGLKDQLMALKWIKKNIRAFGGDPNNVTIFGESAGSVSVMLHILSPLSKKLFHRVIMQSGSPVSPWAFQFEPLEVANQMAKLMGINTKDPYDLYNIFKEKTVEELLNTRIPRTEGNIVQSEHIFVPCAEDKLLRTQAFLTDTPYNIIAKGEYTKVPIIIGYNSAEGYYFAGKENMTTIEDMNFYESLPKDLEFPSKREAMDTANQLEQMYTKGKEISKRTLVELAQFEGESGISYPVTSTANMLLMTNKKPVFIYKFAYGGLLNLMKLKSGFVGKPGASHVDELFYLFKPVLTGVNGYIEQDMVNKLTTMWTNFAKYSDPTPNRTKLLPFKWRPAKTDNPFLLVIDRQFTEEPLWNSETFKFWNKTYFKYRRMK